MSEGRIDFVVDPVGIGTCFRGKRHTFEGDSYIDTQTL